MGRLEICPTCGEDAGVCCVYCGHERDSTAPDLGGHTKGPAPVTRHTPGPWYVTDFDGDIYQENAPDDTGHIAQVDDETEEWEANAALIAALPDMLAWIEKQAHRPGCKSIPGIHHRKLQADCRIDPCTCGLDDILMKAWGKP